MVKPLLALLLTMVLQLAHVDSAAADDRDQVFLEQRFSNWPEWTLPAPLPRPRGRQDLIYPKWFDGTWKVRSEQLDDRGHPQSGDEPLIHHARFRLNQRGDLVGDRVFNAHSVGEALLGTQLLSVEQDPDQVNRQLARLKGDLMLETTVIGRRESNPRESAVFFSDELALQVLHGPAAPRISRIETLTRYERCGAAICADQRQVSHAGPGLESDSTLEGRSSRFQLTLTPLSLDPAGVSAPPADLASGTTTAVSGDR
ncbi:MAG: POLO box duplicated region [Cyanobacteriota bacterium]|nr:POLO box duplicated region [Cyanobacteriota bacterium]MEC7897806.1 POLO box duplicated region [Cyanobacteriota bacterium]